MKFNQSILISTSLMALLYGTALQAMQQPESSGSKPTVSHSSPAPAPTPAPAPDPVDASAVLIDVPTQFNRLVGKKYEIDNSTYVNPHARLEKMGSDWVLTTTDKLDVASDPSTYRYQLELPLEVRHHSVVRVVLKLELLQSDIYFGLLDIQSKLWKKKKDGTNNCQELFFKDRNPNSASIIGEYTFEAEPGNKDVIFMVANRSAAAAAKVRFLNFKVFGDQDENSPFASSSLRAPAPTLATTGGPVPAAAPAPVDLGGASRAGPRPDDSKDHKEQTEDGGRGAPITLNPIIDMTAIEKTLQASPWATFFTDNPGYKSKVIENVRICNDKKLKDSYFLPTETPTKDKLILHAIRHIFSKEVGEVIEGKIRTTGRVSIKDKFGELPSPEKEERSKRLRDVTADIIKYEEDLFNSILRNKADAQTILKTITEHRKYVKEVALPALTGEVFNKELANALASYMY